MGPLSLDNFRKNLSASWRVVGLETSNVADEVWRTDVLLHGNFNSFIYKEI
jgi:hypothetical protein